MRRSKKKDFRELPCRPCGGQSPYWKWLSTHSKPTDGHLREPAEGNPDVLPESAHLYNKPVSEDTSDKLMAISEAFQKLSPLEQWAVRLCGYDGLSLEQAALKLKVSVNTVKTVLRRAQKKIRKLFVTRYGKLGGI